MKCNSCPYYTKNHLLGNICSVRSREKPCADKYEHRKRSKKNKDERLMEVNMNKEKIKEKAIEEYLLNANSVLAQSICGQQRLAFYKGAEWMQEQYESNRLKHCDNITREEFDRESEFVEWFFSQGFDRQPTFSDAIEWERTLMIDESCRILEEELSSYHTLDDEELALVCIEDFVKLFKLNLEE